MIDLQKTVATFLKANFREYVADKALLLAVEQGEYKKIGSVSIKMLILAEGLTKTYEDIQTLYNSMVSVHLPTHQILDVGDTDHTSVVCIDCGK